jgi:hypothetical protein
MTERRTTCGLLGLWLALAISAGFGSSFAIAQEQHESSASDLAKAAQNSIADMISVPFQNNFNFHVGRTISFRTFPTSSPSSRSRSTMTGT